MLQRTSYTVMVGMKGLHQNTNKNNNIHTYIEFSEGFDNL